MAFADTIVLIPLPSGAGGGTGLTVPLLKAFNHATVALTHDATCGTISRETLDDELEAIATHISVITAPTWATENFINLIDTIQEATLLMRTEAPAWTDEEVRNNLTLLTARIPTVLNRIDAELAGFTDQGFDISAGTEL